MTITKQTVADKISSICLGLATGMKIRNMLLLALRAALEINTASTRTSRRGRAAAQPYRPTVGPTCWSAVPFGVILIALSSSLLAGCESLPETSDISVRVGMSRDDLKRHYGEPLRIERVATGGEDWYYRFIAWKSRPVGSSETTTGGFGEKMSTVSVGLSTSRDSGEYPIHVSAEGRVIAPLPDGKVVQN